MFVVRVKWDDRNQAEWMVDGTTTTVRKHAALFRTYDDANQAGIQTINPLVDKDAKVERWWVAEF